MIKQTGIQTVSDNEVHRGICSAFFLSGCLVTLYLIDDYSHLEILPHLWRIETPNQPEVYCKFLLVFLPINLKI